MPSSSLAPKRWWAKAALSGAVAGAIYGPIEAGLVALVSQTSFWALPHRIAGLLLGSNILSLPISPGTVLIGIAVHMALAVAFGLAIVVPVKRAGPGMSFVVGSAVGVAIYLVSYHVVAPILFPWMLLAQGVHTLLMHVAFALITVADYERRPPR